MLDRVSAAADTDNAHRETLAWRVGGMDHASFFAEARMAAERLPGHLGAEVKSVAKRLTSRRPAGGMISVRVTNRHVSAREVR